MVEFATDFADAAASLGDDEVASAVRGARPIPPLPGEAADAFAPTPYRWCEPDTIPQRRWILGRWLLRGVVTAIVAPGGLGKTTFLTSTAMSLCTGRSLLGKTVWEGPKRVWLWNLEDSLQELQRSVQAAAIAFDLAAGDLAERLFVDTAMDGMTLCTAVEDEGGFRIVAPVYAGITAALLDRKIDVLVIDPFVSSHEVEENANTKIDKIAKAWARVANDAQCSIVLVHHTSKAGAGEVTTLSARGAKALTDACRTVLVLNRMEPETADGFGFDDQERRRYFSVQDDKHNRAPAENADWFRLASIDLGNGGLGSGDSVGVAQPWEAPDPFAGLTGSHLLLVQQAISADKWRDNWQAEKWVGQAVANVLGLNPDAKSDRKRILQMIKTWKTEGALITVDGQDDRRKPVKFVEVGKWQNDTSAPPKFSGAERSGAVEPQICSTTTPSFRGGWSGAAAKADRLVEQGFSGARAPIFAAGESEEDDVPGWPK